MPDATRNQPEGRHPRRAGMASARATAPSAPYTFNMAIDSTKADPSHAHGNASRRPEHRPGLYKPPVAVFTRAQGTSSSQNPRASITRAPETGREPGGISKGNRTDSVGTTGGDTLVPQHFSSRHRSCLASSLAHPNDTDRSPIPPPRLDPLVSLTLPHNAFHGGDRGTLRGTTNQLGTCLISPPRGEHASPRPTKPPGVAQSHACPLEDVFGRVRKGCRTPPRTERVSPLVSTEELRGQTGQGLRRTL